MLRFSLTRSAIVCAAALTAALMVPGVAFATTSAEVQAEAEEALASLEILQDELDIASETLDQAVLDQQAAEEKCEEAQGRIDEANSEISDLQSRLGSRAKSMYRMGPLSFLDLLMGAASFSDLATSWDLLMSMNQSDAELVQQTKDLRAEVEDQKAILDKQNAIAVKKAAEAEEAADRAQIAVDAMEETYNSLSEEAAELLAEEQAAQEAAAQEAAVAALAANNGGEVPAMGGGDVQVTDNGDGTVTVTDSSGVSQTVTGDYNDIVSRAQSWVGKGNYVYGACSEGSFDCSGFVSYCLTGSYDRIGSTSTFLQWNRVTDPQPGDVCVSNGHCGIYIGNGQMIDANSPKYGIKVSSVQGDMVYVRQ